MIVCLILLIYFSIYNHYQCILFRWLPTLLAAAHGKLMINIALGFDSYLVMRHGHWEPLKHREPVGCYFCSDVVTASNSLKDRTLDQQCTVTRPGSSYIASGLGVELMVACIHANENDKGKLNGSSDIPHQIRGSLNHFDQKQFMVRLVLLSFIYLYIYIYILRYIALIVVYISFFSCYDLGTSL